MFKRILFILNFFVLMAGICFSAPEDLDPTFSGDGVVTYDSGTRDSASAVAIQPDGKIVVTGVSFSAITEYAIILRYNSDGTLDTTFGGDGIVIYSSGIDIGNAVVIQPDGKIVVAGSSSNGTNLDVLLLRFNSNGTLDNTFGINGVVRYNGAANGSDSAESIALQPDGKIVVVGYTWNGFQNYNDALVLRFNSNGTLDNTFGTNGVATYNSMAYSTDYAEAVALQSDGKIVIAGHSAAGTNTDVLLLRFNSNGIFDNTFNGDGIVTYDGSRIDEGYALAIQPDGKIVIGGGTASDGNTDVLVLRYNSDGTLDNTFGTNGVVTYGSGNWCLGIAIQPDGKIVATGFSVTDRLLVLRYQSNGFLDITFSGDGVFVYNEQYGTGRAVVLQSDGKIVVTGEYGNPPDDDVVTLRLIRCSMPFTDVPPGYWAEDYIETIYCINITSGCSANPPLYCPESTVTRAQMAVLIIKSMVAAELLPPDFTYPLTPYFTDVPSNHWAFKYIQKMKELNITGGCGGGNYCPDSTVTRAQMAVFIEKALGVTTTPVCTESVFNDINATTVGSAFCGYIEDFAARGITGGCGGGNYCPFNNVTRAQMAVFLTKAFLQ